jgi:CRISPR-associated protein Csm5
MKQMSRVYQVSLTTITPLHIGTGGELLQGYDYICDSKLTYVLDLERLFRHLSDNPLALDALAAGEPINTLLERKWLSWSDLQGETAPVRYVLSGTPSGLPGNPLTLLEQLKDVYDRPYIPGSSLKGALRTAILAQLLSERNRVIQPADLAAPSRHGRPDASRMALGLEHEAFGPNPNQDVLRALQVKDSTTADKSRLELRQVRVYPPSRRATNVPRGDHESGLDINCECVRAGSEFHLELHVDKQLLGLPVATTRMEQAPRLAQLLDDLPRVLRRNAQRVLKQELSFYDRHDDATVAHDELGKVVAQHNQTLKGSDRRRALLPLGWGAGWESKTLGAEALANVLEETITICQMARGQRRPGDPFPKSRKLVLRGAKPALPLGWVLLEFQG